MPQSVLEEIQRFNAGRIEQFVRWKFEKMRASPFAFFRGADHLFARAWAELPFRAAGPPVLSCGDLHLENFGAYRTTEGDFRFDINDFDEAAALPADFDLIRFIASVLLAGEEWRLTPLQSNRICLLYLDAYRKALSEAVREGKAGEIGPGSGAGVVTGLLEHVAQASPRDLLEQFTNKKHGDRRITLEPQKRLPIEASEATEVRKAVEAHGQAIGKPAAFQVQDVCARAAGVGSLGVPRYLVLVKGEENDRNRLLDVKGVLPSAVAPFSLVPQPAWKSDADRVVESQCRLQARPAAGLTPLEISGRPFRIRDMIPEENRAKLDRFQQHADQLGAAIETAGRLTAWAHFRGADPTVRSSLAEWASGAGIETVAPAAMRIADLTQRQYDEFCAAPRK